jgi:hypothetical protein
VPRRPPRGIRDEGRCRLGTEVGCDCRTKELEHGPVLLAAGLDDSPNLQEYSRSSPFTLTDPFGTNIVVIIGGVIFVIVVIIVLSWTGCMMSQYLERFTRRRHPCVGNPKFSAARELLERCGFPQESNWAHSNNAINVWCTDLDNTHGAAEGVTLFGTAGFGARETTIITVNCTFNAADVAMQLLGEYFRQHPNIVGINAQTTRLNALLACLLQSGHVPTRRWRHAEEDPSLVDPRR